MRPNGGWWPRHGSARPRKQSCLQRTVAAGQGDRSHRCHGEPTDAEQNNSHRVQDAAVLGTALLHNNTTVILRFWIQGCPISGSVPGYVGWDPEQSDPVNDILAMTEGLVFKVLCSSQNRSGILWIQTTEGVSNAATASHAAVSAQQPLNTLVVWCGSSGPEIPQWQHIWSHHSEQKDMSMIRGRWHLSISKIIGTFLLIEEVCELLNEQRIPSLKTQPCYTLGNVLTTFSDLYVTFFVTGS